MIRLQVVAMLVGGLLLVYGGGAPGPGPDSVPDVLGICHAADRDSKVRLLREMADTEFASNTAQADWWNGEIATARAADFAPFVDAVSEAIVADNLADLADRLAVSDE